MKLQFKIQDYQTDAVESTVRVFEGQPNQGLSEYIIDKGKVYVSVNGRRHEVKDLDFGDMQGYKNQEVRLNDDELLKNLQKVQSDNNLNISQELSNTLGRIALDIEMETGTGKTYVYIKTMFELNKRYGWSKFIVVVPSIAIREGVKKSFDITVDHFMEQYGKKARYFVYNSSNLNQIEEFSSSNDISVMIINTQAFNTSFKDGAKNEAARIIYSKRDEFRSRRPIDVIKANNPIIILDEPQKMGGAATQKALQQFNPLFTLNYSATHKDVHNPVYVLDALDAFTKKLVKKIEVIGFELKNIKGTDRYLYLEDIIVSKDKAPVARIEFEQKLKSGGIKRVTKSLEQGRDIFYESGEMNQYQNCRISEILPTQNKVVFSDGTELHINEAMGNMTEEYKARIQIRETIQAHFRKEKRNFKNGIKTLSLFFLDEVKNYRQYDEDGAQVLGRYGEIFEEEYRKALSDMLDLHDPDYNAYISNIETTRTHAGYFSIDKKGHAVNSEVKRGETISDDISAYDLILKNKERLLSLDEPVRFIFSHSALREGWDNPNVFQICSLRQSNSVSQKRQEVGRGLRLCVNAAGNRQDIEALGETRVQEVNKLTVIASEDYATFVGALQTEIKENLYERPVKASSDYFTGRQIEIEGLSRKITKEEADEIHFQLRFAGYITKAGEVTELFRKDLAAGTLKPLPDELAPLTEGVYKLVQSIFDPSVLGNMIENGSKKEIQNPINDNAKKQEWVKLWNTINHKYAYTVSFNSEELIEKSIIHIDAYLKVSELTYRRVTGQQSANQSRQMMEQGHGFETSETKDLEFRAGVISHVKYDLLGKIAKGTTLTRKTVAAILSGISPKKFNMYQANPEEFIAQCIRLIKEQKATMIVDHITYNQIEGEYDSNIFTEEKHKSLDKAFKSKKSIQDYVFTDGYAADGDSTEHKFAQALENATEVVVYAKLPKGFHIPTPVGNYSPDWAIAFQEGVVKHVYFIAETKGSMSTLDLKPIEQSKIKCAKEAFHLLSDSNVKYDCVNDFDALMKIVKGE